MPNDPDDRTPDDPLERREAHLMPLRSLLHRMYRLSGAILYAWDDWGRYPTLFTAELRTLTAELSRAVANAPEEPPHE